MTFEGFWARYLRNPPPEVTLQGNWRADPDDYHCVRWRGYEGGLEVDDLWQFGGGGTRWKDTRPPLTGFPQYGGETLCGLKIESGRRVYAPRWRSIEPDDYPSEPPDEDNLRLALIGLHGITCMMCRNKLAYGISRIIEDLSFIRSSLVGDWVGEEYISREPLIHGKHVISVEQRGNTWSEAYRYWCKTAWESINPQTVNDVEERERITCPDCLSNLAAGEIP